MKKNSFLLLFLILTLNLYTQETTSPSIFMKVFLSKPTVYENEPLLVTYKLYADCDMSDVDFRFPDFDDFMKKQIALPHYRQAQSERYNNRNYKTLVAAQYQLFPLYADTLTIEKTEFTLNARIKSGQVHGPYNYPVMIDKEVKSSSQLCYIPVKPLPEGAPALFTGAVGSFKTSVVMDVDSTTIQVGDSVKIAVEVSGTGNLELIRLPEIKASKEVEILTSFGEKDLKVDDKGMSGSRTIIYTVIPKQVGPLELRLPGFVYFDSKLETYQCEADTDFSLTVSDLVVQSVSTVAHVEHSEIAEKIDKTPINYKNILFYSFLLLFTCLLILYVSKLRRKQISHFPYLVGMALLLVGAVFTFPLLEGLKKNDTTSLLSETLKADLMYVVDVSVTMLAEDIKPTRLEGVKTLLKSDSINQGGSRRGVVSFAQEAAVSCQLTDNPEEFSTGISRVDSLNLSDGTAVGSSMLVATYNLLKGENTRKYIILFTDGNNNSGAISPRTAAEIAGKHHIRLYIVGVSQPKEASAQVSTPMGKRLITIPTEIDDNLYTELAENTGGMYYRVMNNEELNEVLLHIYAHIRENMSEEFVYEGGKLSKEKADLILEGLGK
ncbi:VWA domain-containing protein [Bacteroides sp. 224]|uniref:VWA domain-containing protein n=1 Tax=Bacteroides sp. 224 TaxID=2302936 RepID=UPI0013D80737|nr:VWA domain-containing protein [Bacteroides sp. 224]